MTQSFDEEDVIIKLVVFAILAGAGEDILSKSPDYLLEKYQSAVMSYQPTQLLDDKNLSIFIEYMKKWRN